MVVVAESPEIRARDKIHRVVFTVGENSHCQGLNRGGSRIFERGGGGPGADTGFPEGVGGGGGGCPRDVIRPQKN